ncbi:hypothetical protein [Streptomyces virginiae]|uniref:hypothetical protein n=1 Tax=Streptomyces virginiae TaxID=1961 RepID=UPI003329AEAD
MTREERDADSTGAGYGRCLTVLICRDEGLVLVEADAEVAVGKSAVLRWGGVSMSFIKDEIPGFGLFGVVMLRG